jgi:hypothetical protein
MARLPGLDELRAAHEARLARCAAEPDGEHLFLVVEPAEGGRPGVERCLWCGACPAPGARAATERAA